MSGGRHTWWAGLEGALWQGKGRVRVPSSGDGSLTLALPCVQKDTPRLKPRHRPLSSKEVNSQQHIDSHNASSFPFLRKRFKQK